MDLVQVAVFTTTTTRHNLLFDTFFIYKIITFCFNLMINKMTKEFIKSFLLLNLGLQSPLKNCDVSAISVAIIKHKITKQEK